jgi:hypothetical protein
MNALARAVLWVAAMLLVGATLVAGGVHVAVLGAEMYPAFWGLWLVAVGLTTGVLGFVVVVAGLTT